MNRRLALAVTFAITPLAIVAACTFPDVTFKTESEAGTAPETGGAEASPPVPTERDGDIAIRPPGSELVDASCGLCDCDDDGYLKPGCIPDASEDVFNKKDGDCDDSDKLRNPGAGPSKVVPIGHDGDWDCNNKVEKRYDASIRCTGTITCDTTQAFSVDVKCGDQGDLSQCKAQGGILGTDCVPIVVTTNVTQICK